MPFSTEPLEPHVRAILANVTDADLQTISGKRVRRELVATVPDLLSAEDAKAHKDDLDALIGDVFSQVSRARLGPPADDGEEQDGDDETGENGGDGDASEGADGTPAADEEEDDDDEDDGEKKPPKKKQKRARGELTDEQLARQLSSELNGRQRSTRAGGGGTTKRGGRGGGRGGKRGAKSAARVEESDDDDGEGGKKKRKRKASSGAGAGGGGAKGGFGKEYALSPELAAVVGAEKMSRPQVVKQLWAHIKSNEMQNPENKRQIVCDDAFRRLFNTDRIDMFQMNKVLGQHLHQAE